VRAPRRGTGPLPCKLARAAGRKFLFAPPAGDGLVSRGAVLLIIFETQARDVELEILNQIYRRPPVVHVQLGLGIPASCMRVPITIL